MATSKKKATGATTTLAVVPPIDEATVTVDTLDTIAADPTVTTSKVIDTTEAPAGEIATTEAKQVEVLDEDEVQTFAKLGAEMQDSDVIRTDIWWRIGDTMVATYKRHPGATWVTREVTKALGRTWGAAASNNAQISSAYRTALAVPADRRGLGSFSAYVKLQKGLNDKKSDAEKLAALDVVKSSAEKMGIPQGGLSVAKMMELGRAAGIDVAQGTRKKSDTADTSKPAGNAPTSAQPEPAANGATVNVPPAALSDGNTLLSTVNAVSSVDLLVKLVQVAIHRLAVVDGEVPDSLLPGLIAARDELTSIVG